MTETKLFDEEKLIAFVESFDPLLPTSIDDEAAKDAFDQLAGCDKAITYLKQTLGHDLKRGFLAEGSDRDKIMGHFMFASFMYANIIKARLTAENK